MDDEASVIASLTFTYSPGHEVVHNETCKESIDDVLYLQRTISRVCWDSGYLRARNLDLVNAVKLRHRRCVRVLLDAGASPNYFEHRPVLMDTVYKNAMICVDREIFKMLLEAGADVNALCPGDHGRFPIYVTLGILSPQYNDLVDLCFYYNANPNVTGYTSEGYKANCFAVIALRGHEDVIKYFLRKAANFDLPIDKVRYSFLQRQIVLEAIHVGILFSKLKLMKDLMLFNAVAYNKRALDPDDISVVQLIISSCPDCCAKRKMLEMVRMFGFNLWSLSLENDGTDRGECAMHFSKIRKNPLSLLEASRVAVHKSMGSKYPMNIQFLQVPATLKTFLQFPDVDKIFDRPDTCGTTSQ